MRAVVCIAWLLLGVNSLRPDDYAIILDGYTDFISIPTFEISGSFSVEFWLFCTNTKTGSVVFDFGGGFGEHPSISATLGSNFRNNAGNMEFIINNKPVMDSVSTIVTPEQFPQVNC